MTSDRCARSPLRRSVRSAHSDLRLKVARSHIASQYLALDWCTPYVCNSCRSCCSAPWRRRHLHCLSMNWCRKTLRRVAALTPFAPSTHQRPWVATVVAAVASKTSQRRINDLGYRFTESPGRSCRCAYSRIKLRGVCKLTNFFTSINVIIII